MSFIKKKQQPQIDWLISIIPIILVILLCIYFTTDPQGANLWIAQIRFYFTDTFGLYYLAIGLAVFLFSLAFVAIQRCNRPRLLKMIERKSAIKS